MEKSTKAKKTTKKADASDPGSAKAEALAQALGRIEKAYGRGAIMKLGDEVVENVDVIPSGSIGVNYALGVGGYPRGRIIEIFGPESSGKTTYRIHIMSCRRSYAGRWRW
ncbi:MAG: DNA recombination/repair protein RecA, partial [Muribaculaceae bacterium]|nr:DNA recombination/repair protein RecA [Muribaculaceae bacterium]